MHSAYSQLGSTDRNIALPCPSSSVRTKSMTPQCLIPQIYYPTET